MEQDADQDAELAQWLESIEQLEHEIDAINRRVLDRYAQMDDEASSATSTFPILLRDLPPQDPVASKWMLGYGLPDVSQLSESDQMAFHQQAYVSPVQGSFRLFGLLSSGAPWQCTWSLRDAARPEGLIIGCDPQLAHIAIDDRGISPEYARFSLMKGVLVLSNIGSADDIVVNGLNIAPFEQNVPLCDGYVLEFGSLALRLEMIEED